jgi:choline monooxygenase
MDTAATVFDPAAYANVRLPIMRAETLPPWAYTSEEFYRREVERIFLKEWNFLGRVDRIPKPGDYFTVNFVGVPLIIARDKDGSVHAFANSCQHRGAEIAVGEGNCRVFTCPYHGWTYDLNGKLRGAPGMEETKDFDKAKVSLREVRLETWGGFIFVNFDKNAPDLPSFLGALPEEFASYDCANMTTTTLWHYDMACNWKLFFENAMEEYHVPMVHNKSISKLQFSHGLIEARGNWECIREVHEGTRALLEEDRQHTLPQIKTLKGHAAAGTHYVGIYPSTTFAMTKDCMWWLELHPQGPLRTKAVLGACFPKETVALPDFAERLQYYHKRWKKSTQEDVDISEVQQRGVSSPLARPGRFSHLEPFVHLFANWILDRVLGDDERRHAAHA